VGAKDLERLKRGSGLFDGGLVKGVEAEQLVAMVISMLWEETREVVRAENREMQV